jgi:hypothetical protein
MRRNRTDAGNIGQVDAGDPEQLGLEIERRLITSFLIEALLCAGRHLVRRTFCARKLSHYNFKFLIHLADELLIEAEPCK